MKEYDDALKAIEEAIELFPFEERALWLLARVHDERSEYRKAALYYSMAALMDENPAEEYYARAIVFYLRGNYTEALANIEKAVDFSTDSRYAYLRALIYSAQKEYDQAREQLEAILSDEENNWKAWKLLGDIEVKEGNDSRAFECYERAVDLYPNIPSVLEYLYGRYVEMGDSERLYRILGHLIKHNPSAEIMDKYIMVVAAHGSKDEVYEMVNLILKKQPSVNELYTLIQVLGENGYTHQVLRVLEFISSNQSRYCLDERRSAIMMKAETYYSAGRGDLAVKELEKYLALSPDDADTMVQVADFYRHMGESDRAMDIYKTVLEVNPNCSQALIGIGDIHESTGDYDIALEYYNRATQIDPRNEAAWNRLGRIHLTIGNIKNAEVCFRYTLQTLNPENRLAREGLDEVKRKMNK